MCHAIATSLNGGDVPLCPGLQQTWYLGVQGCSGKCPKWYILCCSECVRETDKSIRFNVWNDENRSSRSLSTCCFCIIKQYKSEWNPSRLRVKDLDGSLVAFGVVLLPPGMLPLECNVASSYFVGGTQYCENFVADSSWRNDDIGRFIKMVIEWFPFSKSHVNAQEAWCSNDTKELATMVPSALPPTCLNCTSATAGL